jgi:hypothetical protein
MRAGAAIHGLGGGSDVYSDITIVSGGTVYYVSTMTTTIPRFLVHLPKDVQEAVEDFRFSRRMESRSAAIRELIKLGLEVAKRQQPPKPKPKKG